MADGQVAEKDRARFLSKCKPNGACLLWTAAKMVGGYGHLNYGNGRYGTAHRFAYRLFVGPIPNGAMVKQVCGNRLCQRGSHLALKFKATGCSKHPNGPRSRPQGKHSNGRCVLCHRDRQRARYHTSDPILKKRMRDWAKEHKKKPHIREKDADYRRLRFFGLTRQRFLDMVNEQDGLCALCLRPFTKKTPNIDHDHSCCNAAARSCGKCIRGLLHNGCNGRLSVFEDVVFGKMAAAYLERFR